MHKEMCIISVLIVHKLILEKKRQILQIYNLKIYNSPFEMHPLLRLSFPFAGNNVPGTSVLYEYKNKDKSRNNKNK